LKTRILHVGIAIIAFGIIFSFIAVLMLPPMGIPAGLSTPVIIYARYVFLGLAITLAGLFVCVDWVLGLPINFEKITESLTREEKTA